MLIFTELVSIILSEEQKNKRVDTVISISARFLFCRDGGIVKSKGKIKHYGAYKFMPVQTLRAIVDRPYLNLILVEKFKILCYNQFNKFKFDKEV